MRPTLVTLVVVLTIAVGSASSAGADPTARTGLAQSAEVRDAERCSLAEGASAAVPELETLEGTSWGTVYRIKGTRHWMR